MRKLLYATAAIGLALASPPDTIRSALAATASALFEAMPFVLAGVLLARLLRRASILEYFGCGCGTGPSARSIPAAAATCLVFGPLIAIARYLAALLVARTIYARAKRCDISRQNAPNLLSEFYALLPAAALAGTATQLAAFFDPARLGPLGNAFFGAALGFVAAPCGLGAVAVAGALRVRAPIAAIAFLCIAGILDFRAMHVTRHNEPRNDVFAYLLLAASAGVVATRAGAALVHPAFAGPLAVCACVAACLAAVYRRRRCAEARIAPALMLAGVLFGAPPPVYRATETTMTDLFAGEHLTFTGALARGFHEAAVVRYAITCCRADAAPVAVRLGRAPPYPAGTWLRVDGTIESRNGNLQLAPARIERVPAPTDPFIYL